MEGLPCLASLYFLLQAVLFNLCAQTQIQTKPRLTPAQYDFKTSVLSHQELESLGEGVHKAKTEPPIGMGVSPRTDCQPPTTHAHFCLGTLKQGYPIDCVGPRGAIQDHCLPTAASQSPFGFFPLVVQRLKGVTSGWGADSAEGGLLDVSIPASSSFHFAVGQTTVQKDKELPGSGKAA